MTATTDVAYLDIFDPAFEPHGPEVAAARAANWYARTPLGIAVLHRRQIVGLLGDRRLRQGSLASLVAKGIGAGPVYEWLRAIILNAEGDDHTRLRRLVSAAFAPRAVTPLRPRLRELAADLVDRFAADGRCEFMSAFAAPYPSAAICAMLGIPDERRAAVHGWAEDLGLIFSLAAVEQHDRIAAAIAGLNAVADELIALRRAEPRPDLLTALVNAESAGDRLGADELRTMVGALVFAGQDTTRNQLGLAVHRLAGRPDAWRALAERPELVPAAVEELLRTRPVVPMIQRVTATDLTVDGLELPAGTVVSLVIAGADGDAGAGAEAEFDPPRDDAPALAFGGGIHYCLGAALARAELTEALHVLAAGLPDLRLDGVPTWRPSLGITGPTTLPITFRGGT